MGKGIHVGIWALLGVLCCVAAWFMSGSNIVFALCFVGLAVALFAISASVLVKPPPRSASRAGHRPERGPEHRGEHRPEHWPEPDRADNPERPRKWSPR